MASIENTTSAHRRVSCKKALFVKRSALTVEIVLLKDDVNLREHTTKVENSRTGINAIITDLFLVINHNCLTSTHTLSVLAKVV